MELLRATALALNPNGAKAILAACALLRAAESGAGAGRHGNGSGSGSGGSPEPEAAKRHLAGRGGHPSPAEETQARRSSNKQVAAAGAGGTGAGRHAAPAQRSGQAQGQQGSRRGRGEDSLDEEGAGGCYDADQERHSLPSPQRGASPATPTASPAAGPAAGPAAAAGASGAQQPPQQQAAAPVHHPAAAAASPPSEIEDLLLSAGVPSKIAPTLAAALVLAGADDAATLQYTAMAMAGMAHAEQARLTGGAPIATACSAVFEFFRHYVRLSRTPPAPAAGVGEDRARSFAAARPSDVTHPRSAADRRWRGRIRGSCRWRRLALIEIGASSPKRAGAGGEPNKCLPTRG